MIRIPFGKWCCGNCQQKVDDKCLSEDGKPRGYVMSDKVEACRALPKYYKDRGFMLAL